MAAEYLVAAYPGEYDELIDYIDRTAEGAEHEDDLFLDGDDDPMTLRVMRHFYRPTDEAGLAMDGFVYPSSWEWVMASPDANAWDWNDGLLAYAAGDKDEAYFVLGHVVHLIQDLTVPAHTHLDEHGPPSGDDYESYCSALMADEFHSELPLPPPGSPIPEFTGVYQAWRQTSEASYWRAMYPGLILGSDSASGVLTQMFPDLSWSWFSENWTISEPPVGALEEDFFEHQAGYYYFKNAEHAAVVDRVDFDPLNPRAQRFAANTEGAPMTELMARDLVPIAVLHGAGVMKLYLDEARALAPIDDPSDDLDADADSTGAGCRVAAGSSTSLAPLLLLALCFALAPRRRS